MLLVKPHAGFKYPIHVNSPSLQPIFSYSLLIICSNVYLSCKTLSFLGSETILNLFSLLLADLV